MTGGTAEETGTVALVTGGASGIGAAVVRLLVRRGASVVLADLDTERGTALAAETGAVFVRTDVASEPDNTAAVAAAVREYGRLDLVHLNAGIGGGYGIGADFDVHRYRRTVAVNLDATVFGVRAALPELARAGGGAVVVTASLAGIAPAWFDPFYSATKHAVIGLVRSLAPTLTESGVTINAICPGFVDTPLAAEIVGYAREHGLAVASPEHLADAVCTVARLGSTGGAWVVQADLPPEPVRFPAVDLPRTG